MLGVDLAEVSVAKGSQGSRHGGGGCGSNLTHDIYYYGTAWWQGGAVRLPSLGPAAH